MESSGAGSPGGQAAEIVRGWMALMAMAILMPQSSAAGIVLMVSVQMKYVAGSRRLVAILMPH